MLFTHITTGRTLRMVTAAGRAHCLASPHWR